MAETLYDILGVSKTATVDAIRKTYRKLARKHHPDVNPGDAKAEETFKRASSAYEVLSDEKRRAAYDEFGEAYRWPVASMPARRAPTRSGRTPGRSGRATSACWVRASSISRRCSVARGPARGSDLHATVEVDLRQAIEGAEVSLELPGQGTIRVRIPVGADTGSIIRLAGKGSPGGRGGPAGDLVIETAVRPHPLVRRDGLDLYLTVPVTLDEAFNGAAARRSADLRWPGGAQDPAARAGRCRSCGCAARASIARRPEAICSRCSTSGCPIDSTRDSRPHSTRAPPPTANRSARRCSYDAVHVPTPGRARRWRSRSDRAARGGPA